MRVELIAHTPDPDRVVAAAARVSRSRKSGLDLYEDMDEETVRRIINLILEMGHMSVLEHASFTFSISGVSRVLTHQLVRHRFASYTQQSQRVIKVREPEYVTPPSISANPEALEIFRRQMEASWETYRRLMALGVPKEDARFVLPQAVKTSIVVTMNARELWHFFSLRTCMHAQWEIRALAWRMLSLVKKVAPITFEKAGPPCFRGFCPEGDKECPLYPGKSVKYARE